MDKQRLKMHAAIMHGVAAIMGRFYNVGEQKIFPASLDWFKTPVKINRDFSRHPNTRKRMRKADYPLERQLGYKPGSKTLLRRAA